MRPLHIGLLGHFAHTVRRTLHDPTPPRPKYEKPTRRRTNRAQPAHFLSHLGGLQLCNLRPGRTLASLGRHSSCTLRSRHQLFVE